MLKGKVIGNIVSTRKNENIVGSKILEIRLVENNQETDKYIIAIDSVGATAQSGNPGGCGGRGHYRLIYTGSGHTDEHPGTEETNGRFRRRRRRRRWVSVLY